MVASAFGGIVGLNRPLDAETAGAIAETFIECVVAPEITDEARDILRRKMNLRLVETEFGGGGDAARRDVWSIMGAWLVQERDRAVESAEPWADGAAVLPDSSLRVVTKRQPTEVEWAALRFAWRVCAHVKSNTVIFAHADRLAAVGAGQMSRVDAVNVAVPQGRERVAGHRGGVRRLFPFRDGLDAIASAAATAVVQPGGSKRDTEVVEADDEHGMVMVFAGPRHFRH